METISIPINELLEKAPSHTTTELAEMYNTDYGTIYRILARYRVTPAKAYEPVTKELLEAVFNEPRTLQEAAEMLHTTPTTVGMALKRHGLINGKKPTVKTTFVGGRAFSILGHIMRNPEENLASVGRRFNCTREYVRQIKDTAITEGIIKQDTANE